MAAHQHTADELTALVVCLVDRMTEVGQFLGSIAEATDGYAGNHDVGGSSRAGLLGLAGTTRKVQGLLGEIIQFVHQLEGAPMAGPLYRYVPVDALRALVEYADEQRSYVDQNFCCSDQEQTDSDDRFDVIITALGVPELKDTEDGAG